MFHHLLLVIWVAVQDQLGKLKSGEGNFGAEPDLGADLDGLLIVSAGFVMPAQQSGCPTEVAGQAGGIAQAGCLTGRVAEQVQEELCHSSVPGQHADGAYARFTVA